MSLLTITKNAMSKAVDIINQLGTRVYYTPTGGTRIIMLRAMVKELGSAELVGEFRQGDLKVELDASKLPSAPAKFDTIKIGDHNYSVRYPNGAHRRVGDKTYTYKFVVRGA